ncbi:MAG: DUF5004 domain-containing protein [Bacteroidetes bacterium]|nr:MAG: DUF5004 domain-containing protein [Bacteroidota bacterium]
MKSFIRTAAFLLLAVSAIAVASCGKYEEGPGFSLLSKKARIVGEWSLSSMTVNDQAQDLSNTSIKISIKKDDTYTVTTSYSFGGATYTDTENGTWKFSDDKLKFITTDSAGTVSEIEILMLKNKEMKLRDVDGNNTTIMTFIQ